MKYASFLLFLILIACGKKDEKSTTSAPVEIPVFNADSAYSFVQKQVDFGPRVPNTDAHKKTAEYLEKKLRSYGAQVTVQSFTQTTWDGTTVNLRNIIASFNPQQQKRIMLSSHWDTRPFADKDKENPTASIDGANDGASGVGVLLEIARQLQSKKPQAGVDIILFDGEDWGEKHFASNQIPTPQGLEDWWCLGSQYWSKNPHKPGYRAYYGILLDMVGAPNARFFKEGTSMEFAPRIVDKVWAAGALLGYSDYFVNATTNSKLTDDNYFVSKNAKIPMADVIQYDDQNGFPSFHHTTKDNMSTINNRTLEVVGKTVLYVVYQEG